MTILSSYPIPPRAAAHLVPKGSVILVETDAEHPARHAAVRTSAIEIATAAGASLVLYDRSSGSLFSDPYPSGRWTADVDGPNGDRALTADQVSLLGREPLHRQLMAVSRNGLRARAWLARGVGAPAMAEAVRRTGARLVVRGGAPPGVSLARRLLRDTPDAYRRAVHAPILHVDESGTITLDGLSCPVPPRAGARAAAAA